MIRIVTSARLAALEQAIESAQARVQEVQDAADEAASCHARSAQRLSAALTTARAAAQDHQADAEAVEGLLECAERQLIAAKATVAEQAEQIKTLRADLATMSGAVVLLRYGQLDSVHPDVATAKRHAQSLGVSTDGWRPAIEPVSESAWRICSLNNFAVREETSKAGAA